MQQVLQARDNEKKMTVTGDGAFTADFCLTEEEKIPEDTSSGPSEYMERQAKQESLQIVCQYLSSEWRTAFLEHLESSSAVLQERPKKTVSIM